MYGYPEVFLGSGGLATPEAIQAARAARAPVPGMAATPIPETS
jgi:hypothetical protein